MELLPGCVCGECYPGAEAVDIDDVCRGVQLMLGSMAQVKPDEVEGCGRSDCLACNGMLAKAVEATIEHDQAVKAMLMHARLLTELISAGPVIDGLRYPLSSVPIALIELMILTELVHWVGGEDAYRKAALAADYVEVEVCEVGHRTIATERSEQWIDGVQPMEGGLAGLLPVLPEYEQRRWVHTQEGYQELCRAEIEDVLYRYPEATQEEYLRIARTRDKGRYPGGSRGL